MKNLILCTLFFSFTVNAASKAQKLHEFFNIELESTEEVNRTYQLVNGDIGCFERLELYVGAPQYYKRDETRRYFSLTGDRDEIYMINKTQNIFKASTDNLDYRDEDTYSGSSLRFRKTRFLKIGKKKLEYSLRSERVIGYVVLDVKPMDYIKMKLKKDGEMYNLEYRYDYLSNKKYITFECNYEETLQNTP